ncbi:uncharacterized protein TNCV_635681 [Trichonephila clavipes]|nr:uncharacterized protein TNCV_635681 [Trichonephila clavipes]
MTLRRNDWPTLSMLSGVVLILSTAKTIFATKSSAESTGVSYTKGFMCLQKKKSGGLKSGEQGGQAASLPRPIRCAGYVSFKKLWTLMEKCAGAPSCVKPNCFYPVPTKIKMLLLLNGNLHAVIP